jgi:hypothetical protein
MTLSAPLVVVGSANADMFVEVDRLPKEGETIAAKSGQTFAGGKGANQASCAARLSYPTYFVGQVNLLLPPMRCSCSNAFYVFSPHDLLMDALNPQNGFLRFVFLFCC